MLGINEDTRVARLNCIKYQFYFFLKQSLSVLFTLLRLLAGVRHVEEHATFCIEIHNILSVI